MARTFVSVVSAFCESSNTWGFKVCETEYEQEISWVPYANLVFDNTCETPGILVAKALRIGALKDLHYYFSDKNHKAIWLSSNVTSGHTSFFGNMLEYTETPGDKNAVQKLLQWHKEGKVIGTKEVFIVLNKWVAQF